jgi:hypothetical protein
MNPGSSAAFAPQTLPKLASPNPADGASIVVQQREETHPNPVVAGDEELHAVGCNGICTRLGLRYVRFIQRLTTDHPQRAAGTASLVNLVTSTYHIAGHAPADRQPRSPWSSGVGGVT